MCDLDFLRSFSSLSMAEDEFNFEYAVFSQTG